MKYLLRTVMALSITVCLATVSSEAGFVATDDETVRAIAEPILDDILQGMENNDVEQFSRHFGIRMSRNANARSMNGWYEGMLGNHGRYQSRKYLGYVNQSQHTLVLWKATFSENDDEILLMVYLSEIEGSNVVIGFFYSDDMWPR